MWQLSEHKTTHQGAYPSLSSVTSSAHFSLLLPVCKLEQICNALPHWEVTLGTG